LVNGPLDEKRDKAFSNAQEQGFRGIDS
jgi:hypothetical protein